MTPPPEYVKSLYFKNSADSKTFKENIRQYNNNALAFASVGMRKNGNPETTIILICALRAWAKICFI